MRTLTSYFSCFLVLVILCEGYHKIKHSFPFLNNSIGCTMIDIIYVSKTHPHILHSTASRQGSAIGNLHFGIDTSALTPQTFHLAHHVHPLDDFTEDRVFTVQPGCVGGAYEELGSVLICIIYNAMVVIVLLLYFLGFGMICVLVCIERITHRL